MNISEIRNPLFLKELDQEELKNVCSEIRDYIITYVSRNGGYLSGNLSSVEISVILNKVFSDEDSLLFDGNDLNYTNKILNGKADELNMNSNGAYSLGNAIGLAASRDLEHRENNIVVVVNSNDLLSGRNIEALNLISALGKKLIIVFNDDTTIDRGIGLIDKLISGLRNTKSYTNLKDNVKDLIRPAKKGDKIIENIHNLKTSIKKNVIDEGVFSGFDIDYIGPIDGHNLNDLQRAFEIAKDKAYPCVVHCLTTKGKGYGYAEASTNDAWNRVGSFDVKSGKLVHDETQDLMYPKNIAGMTIEKLMAENRNLVCVTTRNINDYGVANVFAKYPDRCFDAASSAENSLSFASGLALDGQIPYITLRSFELPNAYKILKNQVNKLYRPMIIGLINDGNLDYDLLSKLDNVYVCEPCDADELQDFVYTGLKTERPLIIIYPDKCLEFKEKSDFCEKKLGIWQKYANNVVGNIAVASCGPDFRTIRDMIVSNDLPYEMINIDCLLPIDRKTVDEVLDNHKQLFIYGHKAEEAILKYINESGKNCTVSFIDESSARKFLDTVKEKSNA